MNSHRTCQNYPDPSLKATQEMTFLW